MCTGWCIISSACTLPPVKSPQWHWEGWSLVYLSMRYSFFERLLKSRTYVDLTLNGTSAPYHRGEHHRSAPQAASTILTDTGCGSCTGPLRIMISPPKPGKRPQLTPFGRGQGHGVTPFVLPPRSVGSPLALRHVASQLAPAKRAPASHASPAPQAQAQACYRAPSVRGSAAQASLCPV